MTARSKPKMKTEDTAKKLHPLERKLLPFITGPTLFEDATEKSRLQEVEAMRAVQWLQNKELIRTDEQLREIVWLDKNGKEYLKNGLPERRFLRIIKDCEKSLEQIKGIGALSDEEIGICIGTLKGRAAISVKKAQSGVCIALTENGRRMLEKESLEEAFIKKEFPLETSSLKPEELFAFESLKKRKEIIRVAVKKVITLNLTEAGKTVSKILSKLDHDITADRLTPAMLKTGAWKGREFRKYDIKINVPKITGGRRHFVNEALEYVRRIWLDLGFREMTGPIVQTSFWNFDALFTPQDHPVREMHDTFFIDNPRHGSIPKGNVAERVKKTHENGWTTGSKGWGYRWSEKTARENVVRTHTTVLSSQTIAALRESDLPAKFFAVGKCFRNETLDWHHLFEFNQTEGIVVDPDASFKHLLGYLSEFAKKMGFPKVRFRPAYFPYTEPSVEGDVYIKEHDKWIEFIAAGVFRPEVVKPLLGKEVPVLAWGPGIDRMITAAHNIKDIRELYKNDLKQLREIRAWVK